MAEHVGAAASGGGLAVDGQRRCRSGEVAFAPVADRRAEHQPAVQAVVGDEMRNAERKPVDPVIVDQFDGRIGVRYRVADLVHSVVGVARRQSAAEPEGELAFDRAFVQGFGGHACRAIQQVGREDPARKGRIGAGHFHRRRTRGADLPAGDLQAPVPRQRVLDRHAVLDGLRRAVRRQPVQPPVIAAGLEQQFGGGPGGGFVQHRRVLSR
ncbi:MAG: hypothetical protein OXG16_04350 [Rhodospirillales bacterium]|nr:hypothetical protein [Rhodospirillales bacterium]